MILLDLFCGYKSMTKEAIKKGFECITLDIDEKLKPAICVDILKWDYKNSNLKPDVIWASPDCRTWSIAYHKHRTLEFINGLTVQAKEANEVIKRTLEIIDYFKPKYWFIENPRGRLRHYPIMKKLTRKSLYYGNYGHYINKPTDIWTNCDSWKPKKPKLKKLMCVADINNTRHKSRKERRSKIPVELCQEIINLCINKDN